MKTIIVLQPNGRVVIPAEIRQRLDLDSGQRLEVTIQNGRIILTPQVRKLRRAQALLSEHVTGDDGRWSDELIAERRATADHE